MCGINQDDNCHFYRRYGYCFLIDPKNVEIANREERQRKMKIPKELLESIEKTFPLVWFPSIKNGEPDLGTCESTSVRQLSEEERRMYQIFMNLITEFYDHQ